VIRFAIVVALATVVVSSCLIDRRSSDFACGPGGTCDPGRVCQDDFCVPEICPGECDVCDTTAKTCSITCSNPGECNGTVECPVDYNCTISCNGNNSCDSVRCDDGAASCVITCSGVNACGGITCGDGVACSITADDSSAGSINCSDACRCQVTCPAGECPSQSCPETDNGVECDDGTGVGACNPAFDVTCDRC
jgi:hypothetical protein